jgi:CRP-like cAMP-binding protein
MNWLKPFMTRRKTAVGETIFQKGDEADAMFLVASGEFSLLESGIAIPVGSVVGELGLLSPDGTRTQTLICKEPGELLSIRYHDFKQLYFQNPEFGFYFLQLTTSRLFENIGRLENTLAARDVLVPGKPAEAGAS